VGGWHVRSLLAAKSPAPQAMSPKALMLRTLLVQKKSQEDQCAGGLQATQSALAALVATRGQAEEALRQLRAQQTQLAPGKRRLQELQREEAQKKKVDDASLLVASLQQAEAEKQQAVAQAQSKFTLAAQERRATEVALEELQRQQESALDRKQEEERDEAWRLLHTFREVK
jgi:hypothetical protein